MDTVCPKLYSCRPVVPMEVRIEALGMERVGMESSRARRTRSVCVVALDQVSIDGLGGFCVRRRDVPERISHHQKGYVHLIRVCEYVVRRRFDHLAVGNDY
jgi:hypothetical protein